MKKEITLGLVVALVTLGDAQTSTWAETRRGAWVREGAAQAGDITLVTRSSRVPLDILVAPGEGSVVRRAAEFLAADVNRLTGSFPRVATQAPTGLGPRIILRTRQGDPRWEAYSIDIKPREIVIEGSNPRGTAFGAYELMERMGVDPLHHWTGYRPKPRVPLVLKGGRHESGPPTFRFRGLFHDDEDILPRPIDSRTGYPYVRGTVPDEWYARLFETALRLRMNMVAPYTRVHRHYRVQKMASDWGLYYTSHHYDILLSNPYGFTNFGLAKARGVEGKYDWFSNKEGFLKFWQGGVDENKALDAIWPVGLRGTDDAPYTFPAGTTDEQKAKVWDEAIRAQVAMVSKVVPAENRYFHFTLYHEMLAAFQSGRFNVPEDAIIVWDDNGDGIMRGLPDSISEERRKKYRHGVYYHLAFFGANAKQSVHTVTPYRVAQEWRKIVASGATEFGLTNVSELREHVMETRLIAEIMWDAPRALARENPARDFVTWWSREYFGSETPAATYEDYYRTVDAADNIYIGTHAVLMLMDRILARYNGQPYEMPPREEIAGWERRRVELAAAIDRGMKVSEGMDPVRRQFFREHALLGMQFIERPLAAAKHLVMALEAKDDAAAKRHLLQAYQPLLRLESEIEAAEHAPFQGWYRATWIRMREPNHGWSNMYPRRPIEQVRTFLVANGFLPAARANQRP